MHGQVFGVYRPVDVRRFLYFVSFVLLSLALLAGCAVPTPPVAITGDAIRVENPVARPATVGQNSAAYLQIVNPTSSEDRLLSASGDVAAMIELHETINDGGVMKMTPRPDGFAIPTRSQVELKMGGKHVMLMNLRQDLKPGDEFVLTLTFEKIGQVQVPVTVMDNQ
jgi:copper(I)-binding protein